MIMAMKLQNLTRVKYFLSKKLQAIVCLFIFFTCSFIYLANHHSIGSGDTVPSSLLAFNLLFNHTLNFDAFRQGYFYGTDGICFGCPDGVPHFFVEAPNGHLTSSYPIGNAIISFPIYLVFFIHIKLQSLFHTWISGTPIILPAITDFGFEAHRQGYEKIAGTIATSLSVVIFYLCASLKFNLSVALITTFIYAFATNTWATASQALWQPTISNLLIVSILLCLLKANRAEGRNKRMLLFTAGIFCGFLPGTRPTNLFYLMAIVIYAFFIYRKEAIFLLLGLPTILLNASWNFYYFGFSPKSFLVGGYSRFSHTSLFNTLYIFTPEQFWKGFSGLLLNPNKGLLIFSPIVLFAIPGIYQIYRLRVGKDEQLIGCLVLATVPTFLQYCFFITWEGGWCYGPRYLIDFFVIICFLIGYFLAFGLENLRRRKKVLSNSILIIFLTLTLASTFPQVVGAFGSDHWNDIPFGVDRLWQWQDSQIERSAKSLFYKVAEPIQKPRLYRQKSAGVITEIDDEKNHQISLPLQATPTQTILLKAGLKNTGKTQWFGYQTGMGRGETRIQVQFFDSANQKVETGQKGFLYVSGTPKPGRTAKAIGAIVFPPKPGEYRMVLDFTVQGMGAFHKNAKHPPYAFNVEVIAQK